MMKVHWKAEALYPSSPTSEASDDVSPVRGSVRLSDGVASGLITLSVVADDLSELSERFSLTLVGADGRADIDMTHQTSSFTIRCQSFYIAIIWQKLSAFGVLFDIGLFVRSSHLTLIINFKF